MSPMAISLFKPDVQQGSEPYQLAETLFGHGVEPPGALLAKGVEDPAAQMHRADAVQIPVVDGAWEDVLGEPQLLDAAQSLEQR